MIENERLVKARKKNMKLYAFYRALSTDAIFLYTMKLLFSYANKINTSI